MQRVDVRYRHRIGGSSALHDVEVRTSPVGLMHVQREEWKPFVLLTEEEYAALEAAPTEAPDAWTPVPERTHGIWAQCRACGFEYLPQSRGNLAGCPVCELAEFGETRLVLPQALCDTVTGYAVSASPGLPACLIDLCRGLLPHLRPAPAEDDEERLVEDGQVDADCPACQKRSLATDGDMLWCNCCEWQRPMAVIVEAACAPAEAPAPAEERLTEAECWAKLRGAIEEARDSLPDDRACVGVIPSREGSWEANDLNRTIEPHFMRARDPIAACNELAAHGRAQSVPAPDFSAMSAEKLREWLDERGRLVLQPLATGAGVLAVLFVTDTYEVIASSREDRETAALLALCIAVHEQEAAR